METKRQLSWSLVMVANIDLTSIFTHAINNIRKKNYSYHAIKGIKF